MADREALFHATIPAGTPQDAPLVVPMAWNPGQPRAIHVTIPDGHAGLTGYAIGYAGQQIIPDNAPSFIVSNDEKITHDIAVRFIGSQWTLIGYNTDVYDHTFHVRVEIDELSAPPPTATLPALITADTVEQVPTDATAPADITSDTGSDVDALAAQIAGQP